MIPLLAPAVLWSGRPAADSSQLEAEQAHACSGPVPRRIRVCHIMSADLWAGAEVQVATVTSYLATRPDVDLFVVLMNDGVLAQELRRLGIYVTIVDEHRNGPFGILTFLIGFLSEHAIEIVHTHRHKDTVLGILAAKLADVPHVVRTVHGASEPMTGWARARFRMFETLDKAALWCFADVIIAVSQSMAETLVRTGYRRSAVRRIHNGIDLDRVRASRHRLEVRRDLGIGRRALLIGTAGRLSPVKAQDTLIRAARLIAQGQPHARFVLIGDGPLRDDLAGLARQIGIADKVLFLGARTDVYDLVAAMDVFVLPSLHEGMPMALLEAMALGTPVVAAAVGGIPEIVTDRSSGLLVPPRDEKALAAACLELALNRRWALTLSRQARRVVEANFSRETNGKAVMDAYRAVTAASTAPVESRTDRSRPPTPVLCAVLVRGLAKHVWRRCGQALEIGLERRRMLRLRHDPSPLTSALRSARRILVVCHGNIIRSPFAARLVAQGLREQAHVSVVSAGLAAVPGRPPHPTAALLATTRRVDLSNHAASSLEPETVASSDVIFVMDVPQLIAMHKRFPSARNKTFLLTCLASDTPLEIRDPVDGDESRFEACFDQISTAVRPIVHTLSMPSTLQ